MASWTARIQLKIQVRVQLFLLSIVMVLFFQNLFGFGLLTVLSLYILKVSVLDFGRPSISGSIRSIKMYSWAYCTMQKGLVCREMYPEDPRGAGIGPPSTLSTPLPHLPEVPIGGSVYQQPGTRSYHTKEGFQVSERGIEKGARGRKEQGDCAMYIVNLYMCI